MNCPKCNSANPDGATFCNKCGHKLSRNDKQKKNIFTKMRQKQPREKPGDNKPLRISLNFIKLPFKKAEKPKITKQQLKKIGVGIGVLVVLFFVVKIVHKKLYNKYKYDATYQEEADFGDYWLSLYGKPEDKPKTTPQKTSEKTPEEKSKDEDKKTDENKKGDKKTSGESVSYYDLPVPDDVTVEDIMEVDDKGGVRITIKAEGGSNLSSKQVLDFYEDEFNNAGWDVSPRGSGEEIVESTAPDGTFVRIWIFFEGSGDELPLTYMIDFQPPGADIMPLMFQ